MTQTTTLKLLVLSALAAAAAIAAQPGSQVPEKPAEGQAQESGSTAVIEALIVAREQRMIQQMRKYSPRTESYLQEFKLDLELGPVVSGDRYYVGRVKFDRGV